MQLAVTHFFPGGTKENYDAVIAAVHPSAEELPEGQLFHAAGSVDGGFMVIAVHVSKESWEAFRDNTLLPRLALGVEGGFENPPQETEIELVTTFQP
ncbi:MAG: hypothetical protein EXQ69_10280 [Acidimicrobiia bacterium]|nr:hypothetical protein [Acidimicrobiia bacterium]